MYLVDNLDNTCDADKLTSFVKKLKVRLLSCYEVKPRTSRWQREHGIIPDHRAFRVCINRADKDRFLDDSKWPSDVTVSTWYSMKRAEERGRADVQDVDSDADRRSEPSARRTSTRIGADVQVQPDADRTVIEIDLGDLSMSDNVPGASTPNPNGD